MDLSRMSGVKKGAEVPGDTVKERGNRRRTGRFTVTVID